MENNLLSENNVKYLEDYLRETTYEKLSNKLIKFRQSSDSAVRPTPHNPPTVAKQAQGELLYTIKCPLVSLPNSLVRILE